MTFAKGEIQSFLGRKGHKFMFIHANKTLKNKIIHLKHTPQCNILSKVTSICLYDPGGY